MKKIINGTLLIATLIILTNRCGDDFLTQSPVGALSPDVITVNKNGIESLLIGAYSLLDGVSGGNGQAGVSPNGWESTQNGWVFGSIAGGEAHKGSDPTDQPEINAIETYSITANNSYNLYRWTAIYNGISRANSTLVSLALLPDVAISAEDRLRIKAEAIALRAFYHLQAKKMWNMVPYLDEETDPAAVTNDVDIWPKIEADFQFAVDNLLATGMEVGRWNKWSAQAFLGKVQLYQKKYTEAEATLQDVYDHGVTPGGMKYALNAEFRDVFQADNDNSAESIMAVQYSVNDGSGSVNADRGNMLNYPHNDTGDKPITCCGFNQPSHAFVNSFRTDANGLPLLDGSYNDAANEVISDEIIVGGVASTLESSDNSYVEDAGNLDPRLDWTVGRRGIPYLDWAIMPGKSWVRNASNGGPFVPKKVSPDKEDIGKYTDQSTWTAGVIAANYYLMRFSDLILLLAETKIENGKLDEARLLVNEVRARAGNPAGYVKDADGTDAANYVIGAYTTFADKTQATAALRLERQLELGMEGHRFFDLVRWGVAVDVLNEYVTYEKKWRTYLIGVSVGTEDQYYPIPQRQIDLMNGNLSQNK